MEYPDPLLPAVFVRREKRFLVHCAGPDGAPLVAHTNNTGRMTGLLHPGRRVWLSPARNPARKLAWTLEQIETPGGVPVGVNTALANAVVAEAVAAGLLPALAGFPPPRREVPYGSGSRVDLLLENGGSRVWVEVKNVSLVAGGHGRFPDAPTERGRRHLGELAAMVAAGDRAALVFCSQRPDTRTVGPADDIDAAYGEHLRKAHADGVEILGLGCEVTPAGVLPVRALPLRWHGPADPAS